MTLIIIIFWLSIFAVAYTVLLYPVLLAFIGLFVQKKVQRDDSVRSVTLIIPVCNGEMEIEQKLLNCLELDYPDHALSIVVVSDGSDDNTVDIVRRYESKGVKCVALTQRYGKVGAQNKVIGNINSEIVIFTDVSILMQPEALKAVVSNFGDPSVGAVSCRDQIEQLNNDNTGDILYINYDMLVRKYTTKIGSLIGVTGGFYAVRSEIAEGGWEPSFPPDFYAALRSIEMGYRVIEDYRVIAKYYTPTSSKGEMDRKVRTITRGMWAFISNLNLLNPFKYGMVSFQLFSHKLLRWMLPFFLIVSLLSNSAIVLMGDFFFYTMIFWIQIATFLVSIFSFGVVSYKIKINSLFKFPAMFFVFNLSLLLSWKNLVTGQRIVKWEPTKRV